MEVAERHPNIVHLMRAWSGHSPPSPTDSGSWLYNIVLSSLTMHSAFNLQDCVPHALLRQI